MIGLGTGTETGNGFETGTSELNWTQINTITEQKNIKFSNTLETKLF